MKRDLIFGIVIIGTAVLSSCSTPTKLVGNSTNDDDVYYTTAKAGDKVEYINDPEYLASQQGDDDADYYYYGDYASRINRFNYFSPLGYYDTPYYGYSPYMGSNYSIGLGMGLGYGYGGFGGYGYSPYDLGYGYGGFGGYGGYGGLGYGYGLGYGGYGGLGYGYGGYGYGGFGGYGGWGGGGYSNGRSRPNYANGNNPAVNRSIRSNMPNNAPITRSYNGGQGRSVNSINGSQQNNNGNTRAVRPARESVDRQQQQPIFERAPQTQSIGGGNFGGGGGNSGGGGGGGGRPARP